jgi:hypothetical protein
MEYIKEYQNFRRLKKYLRDKNIFEPLKYKKGDKIVLKNGREATIYNVNNYKINPKDIMGNYKKDYLIHFLEDDGWKSRLNWDTTVDEDEIDQEKTDFYKDTEIYNL